MMTVAEIKPATRRLSQGSPTRLTTTQSILERVAAGDTAAVSECLDRYGDLVWSLARRYLRNATDAEDAVQDIFIDIWGSSARYDRNIASEVAFISTIARRRLIDKIRAAGRRPLMDSLDDDEGAPIDPGVPATVEDDTEVTIVERVLAEMDPEHQKVLSMSLYEGYSHSEIAERLSLPLGTVKTRVRRGLIHIRAQLKIHDDRRPCGGVARMNANSMRDMDRLAELLADEASAALDASDAPELKGLLERNPGMRRDELMQAAALTQVAFLRRAQRSVTRMPPASRNAWPARAKQWPFAGGLSRPPCAQSRQVPRIPARPR